MFDDSCHAYLRVWLSSTSNHALYRTRYGIGCCCVCLMSDQSTPIFTVRCNRWGCQGPVCSFIHSRFVHGSINIVPAWALDVVEMNALAVVPLMCPLAYYQHINTGCPRCCIQRPVVAGCATSAPGCLRGRRDVGGRGNFPFRCVGQPRQGWCSDTREHTSHTMYSSTHSLRSRCPFLKTQHDAKIRDT